MKRRIFAALLICAGICGGCASNELEERCFPMLAIVDRTEDEGEAAVGMAFPDAGDGELSQYAPEEEAQEIEDWFVQGTDFEEALAQYGLRLNKQADYNHLKVLVISEDFFTDAIQYESMLDYLKEEELFPRNTYVCVTSDADALAELDGTLSDDLGSYLEDYLLTHLDEQELVTLGQLVDESENHKLTLLLPDIRVEDGNIVINGYFSRPVKSNNK